MWPGRIPQVTSTILVWCTGDPRSLGRALAASAGSPAVGQVGSGGQDLQGTGLSAQREKQAQAHSRPGCWALWSRRPGCLPRFLQVQKDPPSPTARRHPQARGLAPSQESCPAPPLSFSISSLHWHLLCTYCVQGSECWGPERKGGSGQAWSESWPGWKSEVPGLGRLLVCSAVWKVWAQAAVGGLCTVWGRCRVTRKSWKVLAAAGQQREGCGCGGCQPSLPGPAAQARARRGPWGQKREPSWPPRAVTLGGPRCRLLLWEGCRSHDQSAQPSTFLAQFQAGVRPERAVRLCGHWAPGPRVSLPRGVLPRGTLGGWGTVRCARGGSQARAHTPRWISEATAGPGCSSPSCQCPRSQAHHCPGDMQMCPPSLAPLEGGQFPCKLGFG